jgi:hypothetical protein
MTNWEKWKRTANQRTPNNKILRDHRASDQVGRCYERCTVLLEPSNKRLNKVRAKPARDKLGKPIVGVLVSSAL